jgi:hypothetical protein
MRVAKPAILATDVCGLERASNTFVGALPVVAATGPACATPAPGALPATPALRGRDRDHEEHTTAPSSTDGTVPTSPRAALEPPGEPGGAGGGIDAATWGLAVAGIAVAGLALLWLDRRRRPPRPRRSSR